MAFQFRSKLAACIARFRRNYHNSVSPSSDVLTDLNKYPHVLYETAQIFRYLDEPNRLIILHSKSLPDVIDVYTEFYGTDKVAMRYVPERESKSYSE